MSTMMKPLSAVTVESKQATPTAAVIFLHGLGDTGEGWSPVATALAEQLPHHRPMQRVTLNFGMKMPSWYDIYSLRSHEREDEDGIVESGYRELVRKQIDDGIPANRIVLGGFSQGCALALYTALTTEYKLAGIVGFSGYLPLHQKFPNIASDANRKTKIFMAHGEQDSVVEYSFGQKSAAMLQKLGYSVEFNSYDGMDHASCPEEIRDLRSWLKSVIPEHWESKQ